MKNFSPTTWTYITVGIAVVTGIFITSPPSDWLNFFKQNHQDQTNINVANEVDPNLIPEVLPAAITKTQTTDSSVPKINATIELKSQTSTLAPAQKQTPATQAKKILPPKQEINEDLLSILNSKAQTFSFDLASHKEDEQQPEEWQDLITEYETANPPVLAERILPREYMITGVLQTRVVSELAGTSTFIVDKHIFSASGNNILIPVGSIGLLEYQQNGAAKQSRLAMELVRITTPNKLTIVFQNKNNLSDAEGAGGVPGKVNNQYFKQYAVPLLFSFANNTANILSSRAIQEIFGNSNEADIADAIGNFSDGIKDQNTQVLEQILKNTLGLEPIITIEAGSLISIRLSKDVFFEKPEKGRIYLRIEETF